MNFEGGRHCKIIRSISVPLGLWPYRCTILHRINGAIALTIIVLYLLAQLAVFITHEFSVDLFHMAVSGIVPPTFCIIKYSYFMWNMDQVKYVFEWIQSDYDSLTDERELRLIEKFADRGANISKSALYCLVLGFIPIGIMFLPVLFSADGDDIQSRSELIPLKFEYFVDQDRYLHWVMFHISASTILSIPIAFVTESVTVHFIVHACGLLDITRFIENINTSLLPHYCIVFCIGVVSLSTNLYVHLPFETLSHFDMFATENPYNNLLARAMLQKKVTVELATAVILIVLHLFYLGCANYVFQMLINVGDELFTRTYYARWHEAPLPVQKMLLYIRQRCMTPASLVFSGLYTGSLEFFSKLFNISLSYFTVLYSTA